jgi:hypothetical protein
MPTSPYHDGERLVQTRAGVLREAARLGPAVRDTIPPAAAAFLAGREMLVVGSVAPDGAVWASLLAGPPGFAAATDERTVRVDAAPRPADPLAAALAAGGGEPIPVGVLAIEFATRRRMRLNGLARRAPGCALQIETSQVYSNCPKYIQARSVEPRPHLQTPTVVSDAGVLTDSQRRWVESADTFFIASAHPTGGVDASHRGGRPGFLRAAGADRLSFPDYHGNNMFNTLGNLAVHPAAGLLLLDFDRGRTLQITGIASIDWAEGADELSSPPRPPRQVDVRIRRVIETADAIPCRYPLLERSPFNPPL